MKHPDNYFTIEEVERLCQLYQDCQLSVLEETELEYVLLHIGENSPLIEETKALMAVSRSIQIADSKKPRQPVWLRAMRVAACVAMMLGFIAVFRHSGLHAEKDCCLVYVAGERASDKVAHDIAEADVAKMQQFMLVVNEQKASEQAKVEQFMNHINQSK